MRCCVCSSSCESPLAAMLTGTMSAQVHALSGCSSMRQKGSKAGSDWTGSPSRRHRTGVLLWSKPTPSAKLSSPPPEHAPGVGGAPCVRSPSSSLDDELMARSQRIGKASIGTAWRTLNMLAHCPRRRPFSARSVKLSECQHMPRPRATMRITTESLKGNSHQHTQLMPSRGSETLQSTAYSWVCRNNAVTVTKTTDQSMQRMPDRNTMIRDIRTGATKRQTSSENGYITAIKRTAWKSVQKGSRKNHTQRFRPQSDNIRRRHWTIRMQSQRQGIAYLSFGIERIFGRSRSSNNAKSWMTIEALSNDVRIKKRTLQSLNGFSPLLTV
mmetsp:Transcript_58503/g.163140  ORF Transcript_58503/g.163140 Transcript_58503/m.163140 type:complete len:327 (+) Transcript_58503:390-1370(+)